MPLLKISIILFIYSFYSGGNIDIEDRDQASSAKDSILIWIESSKNNNFPFRKRKSYLDKAYQTFKQDKDNTVNAAYLSKIAFAYYKLNDSLSFRKVNRHAMQLALRLNDSASLADNYWDLGNFYSNKSVKDSAYFTYSKAQKIYNLIGNDFYSGRMLLNMAIIQSDLKDYTGSEISTTKAIEVLKPLKEYKHLYRCYNNLGINFNELGEFEKSLFYHNKALEYQSKIVRKNTFKENTLNNLGVVYKSNNNHKEAIKYFKKALANENLRDDNLKLYAMLLDNLAYSKFKLNDLITPEPLFYESLKIRDSIKDHLGLAVNKLHLAEFYNYKKDTTKALEFAYGTKQLAESTKNYRELLSVLRLLSRIDRNNSHKYANQHIELSNSLLKEERATRNKFARIRFETDEFIDENERLNRQRKIIISIAGLTILIGLLLYILRNQKAKNKELKYEQQQQKANEEIYKLMISQQNKMEEGSRKEKKRISQELHDGVLGKIFGTRLILGTLNDKSDHNTKVQREKYINELQDIEEEIRNISHELHDKSQLKNIGYPQMIENYLENQSKMVNFTFKFDYDEDILWENLDGGLKMNLYRIIQEAIQNINKYAKASKVTVDFRNEGGKITLKISDDGVGFNPDSNKKGIGLTNIKARIENFDGHFIINSSSHKGTLLIIEVPYEINEVL